MKATSLIIMGIFAIGLAACQGGQTSKTTASAPESSQPAGNEVRDVKQAETSAAAALETKSESPAAKQQMMEQMQQEPAKATKAPAKQTTTAPAKPVTQAPKPSAPAPAAKAPRQVASALPAGDAARGEKIAGKCKACHNFNDKKKVGPGLAGVVGRKVGSMAGVSYSSSLQNGNWVWDAAHLAPWLCDTVAAVKQFTGDANAKTKMPAVHVCDPQQQADLIAYLKTL